VKLADVLQLRIASLSLRKLKEDREAVEYGKAREERLVELLKANEARINAVATAARARFGTLERVLHEVTKEPELQDIAKALQPKRLRRVFPQMFSGTRGPRPGTGRK